MKLDSAILTALNLPPDSTTVSSHGGSGFSSTLKVTTKHDNDSKEQYYFIKTSTSNDAEIMFTGEFASLNAIHDAVPSLCPKALAHGRLDGSGGGYYLATEFLDMSSTASSSSSSEGGTGDSLAAKLVKLHTTSVTNTNNNNNNDNISNDENGNLVYGFSVPTCCGSTIQDNTYEKTWTVFFAKRRLLAILSSCESAQGTDKLLRSLVETVAGSAPEYADGIVHRLLSPLNEVAARPVICHGDLWSGNAGVASIPPRINTPTAVVFDASSVYAPAEYDHGIMRMFGGFGGGFWTEYWAGVVKGAPVEEYDDRVALYQAYHYLNHYALFGGGYKGSAKGILEGLVKKYGGR